MDGLLRGSSGHRTSSHIQIWHYVFAALFHIEHRASHRARATQALPIEPFRYTYIGVERRRFKATLCTHLWDQTAAAAA